MVEGYDAAPIERASEKALSTRGKPPSSPSERAQLRILSGYDGVIDHLERLARASGCRLERSAVVREVRWRRGRVEIEVNSGRRFHAHRAVVTVPAGVLKARPGSRGAIRFDPEPDSLRRALAGIEMGDVVRLVLRFRETFWRSALERREDAAFLHTESPFPTLWTAAPLDLPMLTLWAGGPAATALRSGGRRGVLGEAFRTLSSLFRLPAARAKRLLVGAHWHDWSADPFTRGAYSYLTVGGASAPARLARPVAGTLFFAGEAASSQESGTVPAAIQSGRRVAARALANS
jgi:monoamine oxidase